jgi:hypothetical protein
MVSSEILAPNTSEKWAQRPFAPVSGTMNMGRAAQGDDPAFPVAGSFPERIRLCWNGPACPPRRARGNSLLSARRWERPPGKVSLPGAGASRNRLHMWPVGACLAQ